MLNIMEEPAAMYWIYAIGGGEKKQRAAEAENIKHGKRLVKKIRPVKENKKKKKCPSLKITNPPMGVSPI